MIDFLVDSLFGPPYLLEGVLRGDQAVPRVSVNQCVKRNRLIVHDVR